MNWLTTIREARQRGYFRDDAREKARDWFSCACSRLDVPKGYMGRPHDSVLAELGLDFTRAVKENKFDYAESLLMRIEQREHEVLDYLEYYGAI